jgi:hypothetical protein
MTADLEEGRIMRAYTYLTIALTALADRVRGDDPERGDVQGWVMITVMRRRWCWPSSSRSGRPSSPR